MKQKISSLLKFSANFDNKVGAIGFIPTFAKNIYPVTLVRCNEQTGEPLRDQNGRCIKCSVGEVGVFVGKINPKIPSSNFLGYSDKKASEKKVLRDVFRAGDTYFNSGDILVMDIFSYFYFKDRTGDTFRWRGENVSTAEVEAVISNSAQLTNCVVYGVEIPNTEGKAGMAAIVDTDHKLDMEQLAIKIRGSLPPYARPIFIRLIETEIEMTGTFKLKKLDLQQEGFNVETIADPIYWLNPDGFYRRLTADKFDEIRRGVARL
jgi:solute carrier family 27 (fatty acid transporter), member 1/4